MPSIKFEENNSNSRTEDEKTPKRNTTLFEILGYNASFKPAEKWNNSFKIAIGTFTQFRDLLDQGVCKLTNSKQKFYDADLPTVEGALGVIKQELFTIDDVIRQAHIGNRFLLDEPVDIALDTASRKLCRGGFEKISLELKEIAGLRTFSPEALYDEAGKKRTKTDLALTQENIKLLNELVELCDLVASGEYTIEDLKKHQAWFAKHDKAGANTQVPAAYLVPRDIKGGKDGPNIGIAS